VHFLGSSSPSISAKSRIIATLMHELPEKAFHGFSENVIGGHLNTRIATVMSTLLLIRDERRAI